MRIGIFAHCGLGGADVTAFNTTRGLHELGQDVLFFYTNMSLPGPVAHIHPKNYKLPNRLAHYQELLGDKCIKIEVAKELNAYNLDILNVHRSGDDRWAFPGLDDHFPNRNYKQVETNFHGSLNCPTDYRIFPSEEIKKDCPCSVIPNAIFPRVINESFRKEFNLEDKFVYGRLGRPDADIYSPINLRAYKQIEAEDTAFLYVAPHDKAREEARNLGIKNIIFVDPTVDPREIQKLYNTMDVFCYSTAIGETFGNSIAEAMIFGLPVIAHEGNSNWPQAHKSLFRVPQLFLIKTELHRYPELMRRLKEDIDFYVAHSGINKNFAMGKFCYNRVAEKYLELFNELTK